jgi:hypothetical protein
MKKFTVLVLFLLVILTIGCISKPNPKDYIDRPKSCFDRDMCYYLNQKNTERCVDDAKECRAYGRYEYCRDEKNRPDRIDFNGCQLYLNQK